MQDGDLGLWKLNRHAELVSPSTTIKNEVQSGRNDNDDNVRWR